MDGIPRNAEWLEADGLGGFASGTVSGVRTRRYHALLLAASEAGRFVLVNGVEAWVDAGPGSTPLSTHRYQPGVTHPDGAARIEEFTPDPWPRWVFRLEDGRRVEHQIFVPQGSCAALLTWKLLDGSGYAAGGGRRLRVRPLCSGRDYHATHHRNDAFAFEPRAAHDALTWRFYAGLPSVAARASGAWRQDPAWFTQFLYEGERERGLDDTEDLASPGEWSFDLTDGEAVLAFEADVPGAARLPGGPIRGVAATVREDERRRRAALGGGLERAADAYLVRARGRRTIIAGYPWFTDWGRDTFIAVRGLCLATGRLDDARDILISWAPAVSEGMLPNLFPDGGAPAEYNAVDASLWYVVAAGDYLSAMDAAGREVPRTDRSALTRAIESIVEGYARGTRYGIRADGDGLLLSGAPGVQLTWMDARIGDWVVTPRRGKPVEVQALWLNALAIASRLSGSARWAGMLQAGHASFLGRFWNETEGCLHDVVDVEGEAGREDRSFRPNQVLAAGGLPLMLLDPPRARRMLDAVRARLLTPAGLRSLAPGEPGYAPRYEGGPRERDAVYHQGTVWPWLMGPFAEGWARAHGDTPDARSEARERFLDPLLASAGTAGLGHLPEIADAEPPHTPRGCPFQAWSVSEALRLDHLALAAVRSARRTRPRKPAATARHLNESRG